MQDLKQFFEKTALRPWTPEDLQKGETLDFFWQFIVPASAADIWIYLSDTARFNRQLALSQQTEREVEGKREVTVKAAGMTQKWIEEPWTWIAGRTLTVTRNYICGLAKICRVGFHVEETANPEHSKVTVYFGWIPSNFFSKLIIKMGMVAIKQKYKTILLKIARHLHVAQERSHRFNALDKRPPVLKSPARKKLSQAKAELYKRSLSHETVDRLIDFIMTGDELTVHRLRIVSLAQEWHVPKKELLLTCLNGVRLGLLKLSWDVICPHCRGVKFAASSLGEIPSTMRCDVCDIDGTTDQTDSIEITFKVHPSIRKTHEVLYCSAEPAKRDHIKVQQRVAPGTALNFAVALKPGHHRVRIVSHLGGANLTVSAEGASKVEFVSDGLSVRASAESVGLNAEFTLRNESGQPQFFVIEEMWWRTQALLPGEIMALKEFRDLVGEDYLKSEVRLALGDQTIMFTDIVGSTKFYQVAGDAKAFREIKKHFNEVFKCVERHNGEIVKTIGDSVMAVFHHPEEGLAAALEIQSMFYPERSDTPLRLRISLNSGPVIAVSLTRGIDYFGSTVNLSAKLQACADASEVALSEETYNFYLAHFKGDDAYPMIKKRLPFPVKNDAVDAYVLKVVKAGQAGSSMDEPA